MLFNTVYEFHSRDDHGKCLVCLQKMKQTEEVKQLKFMTYLNLSSVARKIGDNYSCEKYIKCAEAMIDELLENSSADDLEGTPLLVSIVPYHQKYCCKIKSDDNLLSNCILLTFNACIKSFRHLHLSQTSQRAFLITMFLNRTELTMTMNVLLLIEVILN